MTTTATTPEKPAQPAATEKAPPPEMPIAFGSDGLHLTSLPEAHRFAQYIAASAFCPKGMDAATIVIAIQFGAELGLGPVQAVQNIAVINGRPTLWGDALLALCRKSPLFDEAKFCEGFTGNEFDDSFEATTRVCRRGGNASEYSFSVADAKKAGLWGKQGTWQTNPKRMLKYRARAFALRDAFPDVLKGLYSREEMLDAVLDAVDLGDEAQPQAAPGETRSDQLARELAPPAEVTEPTTRKAYEAALEPEPPVDLAPLRADILERLLKLPPDANAAIRKTYGAHDAAVMKNVVNEALKTVEDLHSLKLACVDAAAKAKTKKKDTPDA